MHAFFSPKRRATQVFLVTLVSLWAAGSSGCHHPLQPLALSPMGHGGPKSIHGPTSVGPLWRANSLSAPTLQSPCTADTDGPGLLCTMPRLAQDRYATALAEAASADDAEIVR